jgi:hypothetical protein
MNVHKCQTGAATRKDPNCDDDILFREKQRIIHLILVDKDVSIDESTPTTFKTTVLAAELAGTAKVIRNTSGTKPTAAPTEGTPRGRQTRRVLGKAQTINFTDFDYIGNENFWNAITPDQVANGYNMYYLTDTRAWPVKDKDLSIDISDEFGDDNKNEIVGTGSIAWTQTGNPVSFKVNTTDFDERQELFDISAMTFTNDTGSTATISGNNIEESSGVAFEVLLDTNVAGGLGSVEVIKGNLPTGVVVAIEAAASDVLKVTGSSVQVGSFPVTIKASNPYGIYTLIPVVVTIV